MYLTPSYNPHFTHPQVIHHPPPGHWSTSPIQPLTPPLIPTPTPSPFYVSPTPTSPTQHAHSSTYTTCIDCNYPPSFDPDYGLTEAITLSCSHFLCFTCWDALLRKLNDMDALRSPRLALGPMCHVCPLELIRCSPCAVETVAPSRTASPLPDPSTSPPSLIPFPRRLISAPSFRSPLTSFRLPPATPPDSPPPSLPPTPPTSPVHSPDEDNGGFESETEIPQLLPAWRTRARRSAGAGSSTDPLPPDPAPHLPAPPPADDPHELLPSLVDPSELISHPVAPDPFDLFPQLHLLPPIVPSQPQPAAYVPIPISYFDLIPSDTQRSPDDKPFLCKMQDCYLRCGPGHVSFATAGALRTHLGNSHKPVTRIPPAAYELQGIVICPHCPTLYTQQGTQGKRLATHIAKHHGDVSAALGPSAPLPSVPNVPLHAPDKDPYLANLAFFESIDLSSPKLSEVYNKAIKWPDRACDAIDVTVDKFLHHHLSNLDETAPMAAILLVPRMLLHPCAPGLSRNLIADDLILRVRVLEDGGAETLSERNNWLAHAAPSDEWRVLDSDEVNAQVAKTVERVSPSRGLGVLSQDPHLPPTPHTFSLASKLYISAPNPDLDKLTEEARRYLPSAPLGSGYIGDEAIATRVLQDWNRHNDAHRVGAPDGTGVGADMLSDLPKSRRRWNLCCQAISEQRVSPQFADYLASGTFIFTAKPDKSNPEHPFPADHTKVTGARPLLLCPTLRRLVSGFLAVRYTVHNRRLYSEKLQFGLIASGTEAATRDVLLTVDLKPPTNAVVGVDIKNAHTTLARLAAFMVLSRRYAETGHALDLAALKYFLLFYRSFNVRYIKVGKQYRAVFQTDGLDQGEAMASHIFGFTIADIMDRIFAPKVIDCGRLFVHDDTTLTGEIFCPPTPNAVMPTTTSPSITPLPYAVELFAYILLHYMRTTLADGKTVCFQPFLPAGHPCLASRAAHLFPAGTKFSSTSYKLAGCDIATTATFPAPLAKTVTAYSLLLNRLINLPILTAQAKMIGLVISYRPSARYGHHMRYLPPSITTMLPLPPSPANPDGLPYAAALRNLGIDAVAAILRKPARELLDSPACDGILTRLGFPSANSGIGMSCLELISEPCYISSFAATLPLHLMNPFLAPHLSDAHSWRLSKSVFISATANAFDSLTSLPAFRLNSSSTTMRHIASALITPDHTFSPALLHNISHLRTQHTFTHAVFSFIESVALGPSSVLTPLARATWIASAAPGATCLFNAYSIPSAIVLTDDALRTLFCIRLVLRPPGVKPPPLHSLYCNISCAYYSEFKPRPVQMPPPQGPLGIHYYGCNAGRRRTMRHDALLRIIMLLVQREWNCDSALEGC